MSQPTSNPGHASLSDTTWLEFPESSQTTGGSGGETELLENGARLGPYRIVRLLGVGGMGAVYLADQLEPVERSVALKLIQGRLRGGLAEAYFLVERQALARMDHPAIAKVYDAGTTPQGHPWFAMEWVDGRTLNDFVQGRRLSLNETLALFIRVCLGVHHAHQRGVIHRDLKPGNVLVAEIDGEPLPKIIDFGVAIGASPGGGSGGSPLLQRAGTRGYMSPEQLVGNSAEIDIRTDVYALGVMLLELLAPVQMIDGAEESGLSNRDLHAALMVSLGGEGKVDADVLRELQWIPHELRWLLANAMHPDRTHRYDSVQSLADDAQRYLDHRALRAVPRTLRYRIRTFVSRHRLPLLAALLATIGLIGGSAAAVWGLLKAEASAERATIEAKKSQQVAEFLSDVLSGVDPDQAQEMDKTLMRTILDKAAQRADKELADQPEALAQILMTIGTSYEGVSEFDSARKFLERGLAVSTAMAGAESRQSLDIQNRLARVISFMGKDDEAFKMDERTLAAATRSLGPNSRVAITALLNIAWNERQLGQYAAGEKRMREALPAIEQSLGADDKLTLDGHHRHAALLADMGRYNESETEYQHVVDRRMALYGPNSTYTLSTENSMAVMYLESRRFPKAEKLLKGILPIYEVVFGPEHSQTLHVVNNLGGALREQGKVEESGPYYRRALDGLTKKHGEDHPNVLMATDNYANYLLDAGQADESLRLHRKALAGVSKIVPPEHEVIGEIHFGIGKALLAKSDYKGAETELLAAQANKEHILGADHWRNGEVIDVLIKLYQQWGRADETAIWKDRRAALKKKPEN
jgi:eukaryotic-like serine/threonine-protein kinase